MQFPRRRPGRLVVRATPLEAITVLTSLAVLSVGVARADPPQDSQSQPNRSQQALADFRIQADLKKQLQLQNEAAAKVTADMAEAVNGSGAGAAATQLGFSGPVPAVGMGGLVPNAGALAAYISATYPGVQAIGGVRADPLPDHPSGHAIDIMIGDMDLGDAINADVQRQAGRFGVVYTMWRVANHFNHVHVTVS